MHIVVSGWFWEQPNTGSGQYLHRLLPHLAGLETSEDAYGQNSPTQQPNGKGTVRYTLLLPRAPKTDEHIYSFSQNSALLTTVVSPPPRLPRQLAKLYWEQVTVPRCAQRLDADLLLVPYWAAPLWQPKPTVVTVHDLIPLLLPSYRGGLPGRLYTRLVSNTARRCAAVLTVSEASRRDIIDHLGLLGQRVFAIHHGPNSEDGEEAREAGVPDLHSHRHIARKYSLPEHYFLYLGGFDVRKNVLGIVRAYRRYLDQGGDPAVQLVLAGKLPDADSAFFPDPQLLVRQLELTEHVCFVGWVDEEDKAALNAGATAFLFPSSYEGFGMMVLEAMAAGTPVITSSE